VKPEIVIDAPAALARVFADRFAAEARKRGRRWRGAVLLGRRAPRPLLL